MTDGFVNCTFKNELEKMSMQIKLKSVAFGGFQVALVIKNLPANAGDIRDVGSIPWRRAWLATPAFLSGESHGQRSLAGYIQSMGSQRVGHN